jgi:hypothetical protein
MQFLESREHSLFQSRSPRQIARIPFPELSSIQAVQDWLNYLYNALQLTGNCIFHGLKLRLGFDENWATSEKVANVKSPVVFRLVEVYKVDEPFLGSLMDIDQSPKSAATGFRNSAKNNRQNLVPQILEGHTTRPQTLEADVLRTVVPCFESKTKAEIGIRL